MRTLDEFEQTAINIAGGVIVNDYSLKLITQDNLVYWFLFDKTGSLIYASSTSCKMWFQKIVQLGVTKMMLEIEAANGEEAIKIAEEAGYALDALYVPIPMSNGTSFVLRGERSKGTKSNPKITEWSDTKLELFATN